MKRVMEILLILAIALVLVIDAGLYLTCKSIGQPRNNTTVAAPFSLALNSLK